MDALVDVRGEEQIPPARLADDTFEPRFVNREVEVGAVPRVDTRLVQVDDGDLDMRAPKSNYRTRWSSCTSPSTRHALSYGE